MTSAKLLTQTKLLLWKRYIEFKKSPSEFSGGIVGSMLLILEIYLLYAMPPQRPADTLEVFLFPVIMTSYAQKVGSLIMSEKAGSLIEAMKLAGLRLPAYWLSYFICDGLFVGVLSSIALALVSSFGLFNNADFSTLLLMYVSSFLSNVSFAFIFVATCDTLRMNSLIYAILTTVLYLSYFSLDGISTTWQFIACLFPPLACQIAAGTFRSEYIGLSVQAISLVMMVDSFVFLALSWYISEVWPSKYGISKPADFLFNRSYWNSDDDIEIDIDIDSNNNDLTSHPLHSRYYQHSQRQNGSFTLLPTSGDDTTDGIELYPVNNRNNRYGVTYNPLLTSDTSDQTPLSQVVTPESDTAHPSEPLDRDSVNTLTINIKGLRKTYDSKLVVNHVHLNLHENQIFVLLGHNGAGKTTLVNMLVGLVEADDICTGDATVYGHSVKRDMDRIRRVTGVCMQQDLLLPQLSVYENILLFARLKGSSDSEAVAEVESLLKSFDLVDRRNNAVTDLSGGEKRKVSVAIAVCGGSKFIALDEPTAGMDVDARRKLWDLLATLRQGRTVLLTTHYMDEAEVLGDRVAIIAKGKMQCIGSAQFLKHNFGMGYKLILGRMDEQSDTQFTALQTLLSTSIPLSEINHELTDHTQIVYTLPYSTQSLFGALFKQLEGNLSEYGLTSMGIISGTLDEVFFKLGGEDTETYGSSDLAVYMSQYMYPLATSVNSTGSNMNRNNDHDASMYQLFERLISQVKAIASRKVAHAKKDQYTNFLITPIILLSFLASMVYQALLIPPGLQIPINNATSTATATATMTTAFSSMFSMPMSSSFVSPYTWIANHQSSYTPLSTTASSTAASFINYIPEPVLMVASSSYSHIRSLAADKNAGNLTITDDAVLQLFQHAPPTLLADVLTIFLCYIMFLGIPGVTGEFIVRERVDKLRSLLAVEGCTAFAYWLGTMLGDLSILSFPLLVMFFFWFLGNMTSFISTVWPALLILAYVCQLIAFSYCWSFIFTTNKNSIATLTSMGLRLAFVPIVSISTGVFLYSFLQPFGYAAASPIVLVRMYVWCVSVFSPQYGFLLGLLNLLHLVNLPVFSMPIAVLVMLIETLAYFLYALHLDSLAYSREERRVEMSEQAAQQLRNLHPDVAAERSEAQRICRNMILQSPSFHSPSSLSTYYSNLESPSFASQPFSNHIVNDQAQHGGLLVDDLRKVFPPPRVLNMYTLLSALYRRCFSSSQSTEHGNETHSHADSSQSSQSQQTKSVIAVEGVSFHVKKGEIFGLLGGNGAGKSSTISMITRDILPTSGEAFLAGISILSGFRKAAQQLGVVYQTNALWEYLTVNEHLKLMAQLRGVHETRLSELLNLVVSKLQLTSHQDKLTKDLSGGMKRKLCVAIALIGNPSIILLDEPCAGLDPLSRKNLRALITACMSDRAVVLTTHSMDEADALCHKIAIMAKGQIRAIGSRQHLKDMFGQHYEVVIKLKRKEDRAVTIRSIVSSSHVVADTDSIITTNLNESPRPVQDSDIVESVVQYLTQHFPSTRLVRNNGGLLVFHIPQCDVQISAFFTCLEAGASSLYIDHYSLDQPSLEQVFLHTVARFTDLTTVETATSATTTTATSAIAVIPNATIVTRQATDEVSAEVSTLDLYYSGRFNSFGCTRMSLRRIALSLTGLFVALTSLFLLSTQQSFIWFMLAFFNALLLILCFAIFIWNDRTKLFDFLFFNNDT